MTIPDIRLVRWSERDRTEFAAFASALEAAQRKAAATRSVDTASPDVPPCPELPSYRERAQTLFDQRRKRSAAFGEHAELFQEAAWDILLTVFLSHERDRSISTAALSAGSGMPPSTSMRWARVLEERRLLHSWPDETDPGERRVGLTPNAVEMMLRYLDSV